MQREAVGAEAQLQHAVAVVAAVGSSVEFAVASCYEDIAVAVGGGASIAGPYAPFLGIRRNVEDSLLLQRLRVVGEDPTVIRAHIARGSPCKIDDSIDQQ